MSNKPNPESVAKVIAAGIVPGCRVRDLWQVEDVVPPIDQWITYKDSMHPLTVCAGDLILYSQLFGAYATVIEPAPALPDTFNASAHSHLITERFPADDEQP